MTAILLYMTVLGMTMVFLFLESRLPRRQTLAILCALTLVLLAVEVTVSITLGEERLIRLFSLVAHLPAFCVVCLLSRFRGWRLLFQFLSSILFCMVIQQVGGIAVYFSGIHSWLIWLMYLILTPPVLWFLYRRLCPLVSRAMNSLQHGWPFLCLVLLAYWCISVYLIPGYVGTSLFATILKPAISLMIAGFYCVVVLLFSTVQQEAETRHREQLATLSLSALQSRMAAVQTAEEALRIERHDLRHRFRTIAELIRQGKDQEALDFIGAAQAQLDEQKPVHWCRPPVLDAVFSSYFSQAQRQGIRVDARIALPDELPVEEAELAIVLSNALENAIHACLCLPPEKRDIRCKVIGYPNLMFELSNPYTGTVQFDEAGLPVSSRAGHGVGSASIAAFCQKYGASCQYTAENGRFTLRVIL